MRHVDISDSAKLFGESLDILIFCFVYLSTITVSIINIWQNTKCFYKYISRPNPYINAMVAPQLHTPQARGPIDCPRCHGGVSARQRQDIELILQLNNPISVLSVCIPLMYKVFGMSVSNVVFVYWRLGEHSESVSVNTSIQIKEFNTIVVIFVSVSITSYLFFLLS